MLNPLSVLPLHLACQLLASSNSTSSVNVNLGTPLSKLATDLPDGYTVFSDIGVAYKFYQTPIPWNEARKYCDAHGANLAVIDSYKKIECVRRIKTGNWHVHVGIHRFFDNTEWTDVKNGLAVTGIPWRASSLVTDMARQGVALHVNENGLFAISRSEGASFVCEVPIFKN